MTPHDHGIEALVSDPSLLGIENVRKIEVEIPLYNARFRTLTDIDILYETGTGISIVELKTGQPSRWLKAVKQLSIGAQYVRERYGLEPDCFYVHGHRDFKVIRVDEKRGAFEPVHRADKLSKRISREFPLFADRMPQVSFYGMN